MVTRTGPAGVPYREWSSSRLPGPGPGPDCAPAAWCMWPCRLLMGYGDVLGDGRGTPRPKDGGLPGVVGASTRADECDEGVS